MVFFPPCKINLGLHILSKREDGFHNIETAFYPIDALSDLLEIIPNSLNHTTFRQEGIEIEQNSGLNLVEKAYLLLKQDFNLPFVDIFLHKNIPVGAGLGGGSSDAAFALKLLNNLFSLCLSEEQLMQYASVLGSDCPFFVKNNPAIGTNRGEKLKPFSAAQLSQKYIVIVKPKINISTADAYKNCKPVEKNISLTEILSQPLSDWENTLVNDFEKTLFPVYPELKTIKDSLYQQGAVYASVSGSGSALFGIFSEEVPSLSFPNDYFVFRGKLR